MVPSAEHPPGAAYNKERVQEQYVWCCELHVQPDPARDTLPPSTDSSTVDHHILHDRLLFISICAKLYLYISIV